MTLAETVRQRLVTELELQRGNVSRAARALGVSRRALYRLTERHHIVLTGWQRVEVPGTPAEKDRARKMVAKAIKDGLPILPCEVCQSIEDIEAHHEDYSKPLAVQWLCPKHHRQLHVNKGYPAER